MNYLSLPKNSRPEVPCKKGALRNFAKFTGKHLWQSLFFNKVAGLRNVNFAKFHQKNISFNRTPQDDSFCSPKFKLGKFLTYFLEI